MYCNLRGLQDRRESDRLQRASMSLRCSSAGDTCGETMASLGLGHLYSMFVAMALRTGADGSAEISRVIIKQELSTKGHTECRSGTDQARNMGKMGVLIARLADI